MSNQVVRDGVTVSYNGRAIPLELETHRWNAAHTETTSNGWRSLFCDTGYASGTARNKRRFFDTFCLWLAGGCNRALWMRDEQIMYEALHLSLFGHVAEFTAHGFYGSWFETPQDRARWVEYARRGGAHGLHPIERSDLWGDVERAIIAWLNESGVGDALIEDGRSDTERQEREQLRTLLARYPDEANQ